MTREVINNSINTMVNQFMRKRALGYDRNGEDDVLERYLDPLSLAAKQVLDDFIRWEIRFILDKELTEVNKPGTLISDYLLEGSFYPWFNNYLMRNEVREVAADALQDMMVGEIVEDMVEE